MHIWMMERYPTGDRRLPHHMFPPKVLTSDQLTKLTGVIQYKVDLDDTLAAAKRLRYVRDERNVATSDILTIDEGIEDVSSKLEALYEPVSKPDDTVFMVLEGAMYYDVEHDEDQWVRMYLERGDMIVIPKGRYFRCTTTSKNFVKLQRFAARKDGTRG
ncbi:1,2-dihydroxy-3-keto-5-methylthiopentene dioxygenase 2 [Aphelenchoides avenae]|nr:1,2-dihydroxy-3-keto-5-methylthiopentene dioxygenase 2 [Aphelenchus avenae]